jgi:hypothetical protein
VTVAQKLAASRANVREVVRTYTPWVRHPTTPETILRATEIAELSKLSRSIVARIYEASKIILRSISSVSAGRYIG